MIEHGAESMLYRLDAEGRYVGDPFHVRGARLTLVPEVRDNGESANVRVAPLPDGGSISITLGSEHVPDLLAVMFCQLDPSHDLGHEHDGRTCVPVWIPLAVD